MDRPKTIDTPARRTTSWTVDVPLYDPATGCLARASTRV